MFKLVLASQSPRRKDLLTKAGFNFIVLPVNISETPDKNLNLDQQILKIAADKAVACLEEHKHLNSQDFLILSADTMVIVDGVAFGKPADENEADQYLRLLSDRSHLVKTALHLINCKTLEQIQEITTTKVFFRKLADEEIAAYIRSGEPMDKAGAYGIQGLGGTFIDHVEGPFDNVVGLSIDSFRSLLKQKDWSLG
jgi:septum formation protein